MLQSLIIKVEFKIEIFDFKDPALTWDPYLSSFKKYILIYCKKVFFVVFYFFNRKA